MSLKATIQQAVKTGFTALGDLAEAITYKAAGTPSYNASTGAVSVTFTDVPASAVFVNYSRRERDEVATSSLEGEAVAIRPEDQKCLLPVSGFSPTPTLNDQVVRAGQTWTVISVTIDPAGAMWVLQVRRAG